MDKAAAPAGGRRKRPGGDGELSQVLARLAEYTRGPVVLQDDDLRVLTAAAATGPVCRELADYPRAADKAKWAARMRLVTGNHDLVSSFDDLGVAALLFQFDDHTDLEQFVERWIGPLVAYDENHGTQLTETLRVLFETRSFRDAAEALFVHKSTLKYRIKRINELLGGDYTDSETFFNLQVALRIHQMVRGLR